MDLWNTKRGWIFCLNAGDNEYGSNWGYVEDFMFDIAEGAKQSGDYLISESPVYGKVCLKDAVLTPGDGIAFYHGKKARRSSENPRPVKPYQISLIAELLEVKQVGREVQFIRLAFPKKLHQKLLKKPIEKDESVGRIIESSGLGLGRVGSFFPVDQPAWTELLKVADTR